MWLTIFTKAAEWLRGIFTPAYHGQGAIRLKTSLKAFDVLEEAPRPAPLSRCDDLMHAGLADMSVTLSRLTGMVRDLASLSECASRLAWSHASLVNQNVSNADDAVTSVEALAKKISDAERRFRGLAAADGDGREVESLQVGTMNAVRLSFNTTVQMVGARSSAQRMVESVQSIHRLAKETQELAETLACRLGGGAGDEVDEDEDVDSYGPAKLRCLG